MYKVVDNFNGWESKNTHSTEDGAVKELEKDFEEWDNNLINRDCVYCKTVVPSNYKYVWNGSEWVWRE